MKFQPLAPLALLALVVLTTPASQAMQLKLSPAELCRVSSAVVVVRVDSVETHWSTTQEGGLERHALVTVDQVVKGPALPGATVVLPGGTFEEFSHWVEDVPQLEAEAHYLLFLGKLPERTFEVLGGEQGAIRIATGTSWNGESLPQILSSLEGCHAQ